MAISLPNRLDTIEVILRIDDALDVEDSDYDAYLETLDKSLLKFHEGKEPTLFVMRKVQPFGLSKKVQNEQAEFRGGEVHVNLGFIMEDVRCSLVDIKNPPSVPEGQRIIFKKEKDGGASEELMELLNAVGAVNDLYRARNGQIKKANEATKKK